MNPNSQVQFFYLHERWSPKLRRRKFAAAPDNLNKRLVIGAPAEIRVWDSNWLASTGIWITPKKLNGIISEESDSSDMEGAGCPVHAYESLRLRLCFLLFGVAGHRRATLAFKSVPLSS